MKTRDGKLWSEDDLPVTPSEKAESDAILAELMQPTRSGIEIQNLCESEIACGIADAWAALGFEDFTGSSREEYAPGVELRRQLERLEKLTSVSKLRKVEFGEDDDYARYLDTIREVP